MWSRGRACFGEGAGWRLRCDAGMRAGGRGGVKPLDFEYLRQVRRLCTQKDVLLVVDEVQTGVGRTGKFLACEHAGIRPTS